MTNDHKDHCLKVWFGVVPGVCPLPFSGYADCAATSSHPQLWTINFPPSSENYWGHTLKKNTIYYFPHIIKFLFGMNINYLATGLIPKSEAQKRLGQQDWHEAHALFCLFCCKFLAAASIALGPKHWVFSFLSCHANAFWLAFGKTRSSNNSGALPWSDTQHTAPRTCQSAQ